jgi:hypothetical protein
MDAATSGFYDRHAAGTRWFTLLFERRDFRGRAPRA